MVQQNCLQSSLLSNELFALGFDYFRFGFSEPTPRNVRRSIFDGKFETSFDSLVRN